MRAILWFFAAAATLPAQPFIFYRGVVNAASFAPPGLPHAAVARGSIFTIFGRGLGPPEGAAVQSFPLTASLAGTSVEVCAANDCRTVWPLFTSAGQVNAVMPSDAPLGRVSLRLTFNDQPGNWSPIDVVESSVGVFSVNSAGFGPGIVQNFVSNAEVPLNSLANAARPGQVVIVWGTGLGPSAGADNQPATGAPSAVATEVFIGDRPARLLFRGRAPGFAGLDQFNIEVPPDAPEGCYVPLRVRTNGATTSNTATIAIRRDGGRCEDPHNPLVGPLSLGRRVGAFVAQRFASEADVDPSPPQSFVDELAFGSLVQPAPSDFYFSLLSLPPVGSCATFSARGDLVNGGAVPSPIEDAPLDAGSSLSLMVGGRLFELARSAAPQFYSGLLASAAAAAGDFVFNGGSAEFSASGGADVTDLRGAVEISPPLSWTNQAASTVIDPTRPLTVTWTGAQAGRDLVLIGGAAARPEIDATALFYCVAPGGDGRFTVSTDALAALPDTPELPWQAHAVLALGRMPANPSPLTALGLDAAAGAFLSWSANAAAVRGGAR